MSCEFCNECENCQVTQKLAYYENLKKQGRLIILASDKDQLKYFEDKCWICLHWDGETCNKSQCAIYIKKEKLRKKLGI